ncbi:MAG: VWA domain-containing protein [Ekhidna sp.]|nr:VWA domain-containing protein [Ekhidna sp.]
MKWVYPFGTFELTIIGLFSLCYLLFLVRVIRTTSKLGLPSRRVIIKFILRALYFGLIVTALLGPSFGETSREIKTVGKDIFICIDLSQSMNATDVQPSRLAKVKFELKNIVEAFNSDRIGLIMFSSEAYLQCPLTYDNNALNLFIQTLNTEMVPNYGTDFGPPLEIAMEKLASEDTILTRSKTKIVILLSDGEDFGDDTDNVAEDLENEGISLFTLGVGTQKGSKIPIRSGFKKDRKGKEVISRLNSSSLKDLADNTNGEYFEINESRNDTQRLINAINRLEGELREAKKVDATQNRYFYFLGAGLILMIIDLLFSVRLIRL